MKRPALAIALAVVLTACVPGQGPGPDLPSSTPRPAELDMTEALLRNELPDADPFALTRGLRGRSGVPANPFEPVRAVALDEPVGTVRDFWTYDWNQERNVLTRATLRFVGQRAKWWIADDVATTTTDDALRTTAARFDAIYERNRSLYGSEWSPGIDADPLVSVLYARIPGSAAGYFNTADELPRWINEFSAEREILYVNALSSAMGSAALYSVLAHEHCHMIQFNKRTAASTWFNEGHAQLCERANGLTGGFEQLFLQQPDTQLNEWPELGDGSDLHYGAAYLFLDFLRQHGGGTDLINAFLSRRAETIEDLDAVLRERGQPGLERLFADFVAANALIGASPPARFTYAADSRPARPAAPSVRDRLSMGATVEGSVHQWAARYYQLPSGTYEVSFDGARDVRVVPTDAHSGESFWWSDRADGLDSTLTRTIDLTRVDRATLSFWAWYDMEADFDYAYVAVSKDGARWTSLAVPGATTSDPNGSNLGNGITGASGGSAWVRREVDLSAHAGSTVQLRFQAVTDDAVNGDGFAVDDVEIPEIGFRDNAEAPGDWRANGFLRSSNVVRQRYVVQALRFPGGVPLVEQFVVEDGTLTFEMNSANDVRAPILAISGLAPRTGQPATFTIGVETR